MEAGGRLGTARMPSAHGTLLLSAASLTPYTLMNRSEGKLVVMGDVALFVVPSPSWPAQGDARKATVKASRPSVQGIGGDNHWGAHPCR